MKEVKLMQGVFTKILNLWIPNKTDKGTVVTDVFEPNFTKLDQYAETTNRSLEDLKNNKMDKYKDSWYSISDYDDIVEDGFYVVKGSFQGATNAPYEDAALVQVWNFHDEVYQNAVSYYGVNKQFTRCFKIGTKNTKWESIVNTANYSLMCPYGIGDLMFSVSSQHPAVRWVGTTWEKQEGRFLLGSSGSYALGSIGGSATTTLTKANLPATKLQLDSFSLGPGTQEITGRFAGEFNTYENANKIIQGAFYPATEEVPSDGALGGGSTDRYIYFQASRTWTGMSTSAAPYTTNMGDSTPFNNMPPYIAVNIWKRLS